MKNIFLFSIFTFLTIGILNSQELFWLPLYGPQGGETHSIAFNSKDHIYVSTGMKGANGIKTGRNGIFRSTDFGATWEHIYDPLSKGRFSNCIAITPDDDIFVGTYFGGIHKSSNHGATWKYANDTILSRGRVFFISSIGDSILLAKVDSKAFRSYNKGISWQEMENPAGASWGYIYVGPNDFLYSYADRKFYWSDDTGKTWNTSNVPYLNCLGMAFHGTDTIFMASFSSGVLRSIDRGKTWNTVNNGLPSPFRPLLLDITVHKNSLLIASRDYGVYKSDNSGGYWYPVNNGLSRTHINSIKSLNDSLIFACSDGGMYISDDDGASWKESNKGLNNAMIFALEWNDKDNSLYAGSTGGVIKSSDKGETWKFVNDGLIKDRNVLELEVNSEGAIFVSLDQKGIFKSTDGESWIDVSNNTISKGNINQILFDENGNTFIAVNSSSNSYYEGVMRSGNHGQTWEDIRSGLGGNKIRKLAISNDGTLFAATSGGAYSTNDYGNNWTKLSIDTVSDKDFIAVFIDNSNSIYSRVKVAPYKYATYRSDDNGQSWNLEEGFVLNNDMVTYENYAFAPGYQGTSVYTYQDSKWDYSDTYEHSLVYPQPTFSLAKDNDGTIYAGTGTGIYITNPRKFTGEYVTICEGEEYAWNGEIYTETGYYFDSLNTPAGEDSIIGLMLKSNETPQSVNIIGPEVVQPDEIARYFIEEVYDNNYHWNIIGGSLIAFRSDTDISVRWGEDGMGAVEISVGNTTGCDLDTSLIVQIGDVTDINEMEALSDVSITNQYEFIEIRSALQNEFKVKIFSIEGKILYASESANSVMMIDTSMFSAGVYIIAINYNGLLKTEKIIIGKN